MLTKVANQNILFWQLGQLFCFWLAAIKTRRRLTIEKVKLKYKYQEKLVLMKITRNKRSIEYWLSKCQCVFQGFQGKVIYNSRFASRISFILVWFFCETKFSVKPFTKSYIVLSLPQMRHLIPQPLMDGIFSKAYGGE